MTSPLAKHLDIKVRELEKELRAEIAALRAERTELKMEIGEQKNRIEDLEAALLIPLKAEKPKLRRTAAVREASMDEVEPRTKGGYYRERWDRY